MLPQAMKLTQGHFFPLVALVAEEQLYSTCIHFSSAFPKYNTSILKEMG